LTNSIHPTRLEKQLSDGTQVISHDVKPWSSSTFSGEKHTLVVKPKDANDFTQRMATFDMDVTLNGWLIASVELTPQSDGEYHLEILVLQE